jgi:hypothetical protein
MPLDRILSISTLRLKTTIHSSEDQTTQHKQRHQASFRIKNSKLSHQAFSGDLFDGQEKLKSYLKNS